MPENPGSDLNRREFFQVTGGVTAGLVLTELGVPLSNVVNTAASAIPKLAPALVSAFTSAITSRQLVSESETFCRIVVQTFDFEDYAHGTRAGYLEQLTFGCRDLFFTRKAHLAGLPKRVLQLYAHPVVSQFVREQCEYLRRIEEIFSQLPSDKRPAWFCDQEPGTYSVNLISSCAELADLLPETFDKAAVAAINAVETERKAHLQRWEASGLSSHCLESLILDLRTEGYRRGWLRTESALGEHEQQLANPLLLRDKILAEIRRQWNRKDLLTPEAECDWANPGPPKWVRETMNNQALQESIVDEAHGVVRRVFFEIFPEFRSEQREQESSRDSEPHAPGTSIYLSDDFIRLCEAICSVDACAESWFEKVLLSMQCR